MFGSEPRGSAIEPKQAGPGTMQMGTVVVASYRTALLGWIACGLLAGCAGPGLEPPWSDDEGGRAQGSGFTGGVQPSTPGPASGNPGAAGSTATAAGSGAAATAGTSATPGAVDDPFGNPTSPPTVPVTMPPALPTPMAGTDPEGSAGAGGAPAEPPDSGSSFGDIDFVAQCDTELPSALMMSDACRYPVPMDLELASTQVAVLTANVPTLLDVYYDAFGCFLGDGYYLDSSVMPAVIVLCPDTCAKLAPESTLVVIEGCAP